jgi:PAS domain S-box-containing protein
VALVPLSSGGRTFGLVQFNDRRPDCFDAGTVAALERLVNYVAIALAKFEAEGRLRASEERYRIVADNTYDWEFWIAADGQVQYMSPSCERITGYPAAAFERDPGLRRRIVASEHVDRWDRHHLECHMRGVPGRDQFQIVSANGEPRWVEHVCQPVWNEHGLLLGTRGSNRDVTDRRQAEEARDRAEQAQERLVVELRDALAHVKTLRGFIPICSSCKKIRDDEGYWQAVEVYVRNRTEAEFSHGLCPACTRRLYPDYADDGDH